MKITTASQRPVLMPCRLEGMDYQIDPYIGCAHYCHYCYALGTAESDWTQEIRVHEDITGQLAKELSGIPPQKIYMGYQTDPYQPCEATCLQTRKTLELLLEKGFSASILTKSDLVLRDADLLAQMAAANVSVSVAFTEDADRRRFEANTMDTGARIEALRQLKVHGIGTAALICPVIPFITDVAALIDQLAPVTDRIWIYGLSLDPSEQPQCGQVQDILDRHFPAIKSWVEEIVFSKDHSFWAGLRSTLEDIKNNRLLNLSIHV